MTKSDLKPLLLSLSILLLSWGLTDIDYAFGNGNGNDDEDKALEEAEKALEKAEKEAEKTFNQITIDDNKSDLIRVAIIDAVDKIIEDSEQLDPSLDELEKAVHDADKESKKGHLVAKVLSKFALKEFDKEYQGKSPDANYRHQLKMIEEKFIDDTQKVKMNYFDAILGINSGLTVEKDSIEDKTSGVDADMKREKQSGVMVNKADKQIRKLLQSDDPSSDGWKFGIDSSAGKTRIILELSDIDPVVIEKIQTLADIKVHNDNLVQIVADVEDLPRINALKDVEKTRPTSNLSDYVRYDFDTVKSPFLNSAEIVKTVGDIKYAVLSN